MQEQIRAGVGQAAPEVEVGFEAFRARAYCHDMDGPWPRSWPRRTPQSSAASPRARSLTATTDARYPEGPSASATARLAGNLHGTDEWVDLDSLVEVAEVIAVAAAQWLAASSNHV